MALEVEKVIEHLAAPPRRVSIAKIRDVLGLDLSTFQSQRRSTVLARKEELAKRIVEGFPEYFPKGTMPGQEEERKARAHPFAFRQPPYPSCGRSAAFMLRAGPFQAP